MKRDAGTPSTAWVRTRRRAKASFRVGTGSESLGFF